MSEKAGDVCVFSESTDVALELLAPARTLAAELASEVMSVSFGDREVTELTARGAERVVVVEGVPIQELDTGTATHVLCEVVRRERPGLVLVGATGNGAEVAARVAQRLNVACLSECLHLTAESGELVVERAWLGSFVARQVVTTRPALVTIPPGRYEIPARRNDHPGATTTLSLEIPPRRTRIVGSRERERSGVRLDRAEIIVGTGRGLRNREDLALIRDLAEVLGGAVGSTRPLTDDFEWLPVDLKIGLSGQTVRPKLYIACGISGQIEHVVGMRESRIVVAINRDPGALIMDQADYRIVDDLYEIVPALTRILREVTARGAGAASVAAPD